MAGRPLGLVLATLDELARGYSQDQKRLFTATTAGFSFGYLEPRAVGPR